MDLSTALYCLVGVRSKLPMTLLSLFTPTVLCVYARLHRKSFARAHKSYIPHTANHIPTRLYIERNKHFYIFLAHAYIHKQRIHLLLLYIKKKIIIIVVVFIVCRYFVSVL